MKVLVVGANGQIGRHVCQLLHEKDNVSVRAMVRREEQAEAFKSQGIEAVVADLEGPVSSLVSAMQSCDAIVFTAGSGGHTGADKTLLVDLDGAVKTIEAAEQAGVRRYIMVSAHQAHQRENWNPKIKHYYVAKHYADRMLTLSDLDYTIIRPGGLLNTPASGKVSLAENLERGSISREDVALTIVALLNAENTYRQSYDLIEGETSIDEAVSSVNN